MESISQFIFEHAQYAHWIVFGALMLAGINIPISEDLMIILSAVLAATVVPENLTKLFIGVFLGCYLSDWVSYWLGRTLGRRLWEIKWLSKTLKKEKLIQIQHYYDRYGFWTLLVGRFIPFGVRNCLFLTAGMGKMPFFRFIVSDGIACLASNSTLFFIAYSLGKNYESLFGQLKILNIAIFLAFLMALIALFWYKRNKKAPSCKDDQPV